MNTKFTKFIEPLHDLARTITPRAKPIHPFPAIPGWCAGFDGDTREWFIDYDDERIFRATERGRFTDAFPYYAILALEYVLDDEANVEMVLRAVLEQ